MKAFLMGALAGCLGYNLISYITKWGLWDVLEIINC